MKKKRVIIAMSGGVDSSTAAAILKKNDYDVVGVFMKFWTPQERGRHHHQENRCCSVEAKRDAQRVAIKLGIPFYVIDAKKEFKKRVVDYLVREYKRGNTPNPCVECNKYIKFKFLFGKLNELKADYIATGHYVKVKNKRLLIAKDIKKDQSYFLWILKQEQLKKILFPLGDYTKEQVRGLAKKFKLPVFEKKDSQEICFIDTCIEDFLKRYIKAKPGPIMTIDGKKVGDHEGLNFYTIGQRKGIKIGPPAIASRAREALRAGVPLYVVKKGLKRNALIVSSSQKDLLQKEMIAKNVNWISGKAFYGKCKVKIRSMAKPVQAMVYGIQHSVVRVVFNHSQRAVTPGQSTVFYRGNEVLGGGIIEK